MAKLTARENALRTARRRVGLGKFRRSCRMSSFLGRPMRAWRVPGTQEHGRDAMLCGMAYAEAERLLRGEPGIFL